jgi:cytochrome c oxidase assembly factor CtaG
LDISSHISRGGPIAASDEIDGQAALPERHHFMIHLNFTIIAYCLAIVTGLYCFILSIVRMRKPECTVSGDRLNSALFVLGLLLADFGVCFLIRFLVQAPQ